MNSTTQSARRINLRSVALPAEHGGWGFLLEPILLGMLLAPSWRGLLFALAMLAIFLIHQPLKVTLKEVQKQKQTERGKWALRFVGIYGGIALLCGVPLLFTGSLDFLLVIVLMIPLLLLQAYYDFRSQSRALLAELAGAAALGGIAAVIVLLTDWQVLPALALWLGLLGRTIPSILYVRAKLRSQRKESYDARVVYGSHVLAIVGVLALVLADLLPVLAAIAMVLLLLRTWLSLRDQRVVRASRVGIQEMIVGFVTVLLIAAGVIWKL